MLRESSVLLWNINKENFARDKCEEKKIKMKEADRQTRRSAVSGRRFYEIKVYELSYVSQRHTE